MPSSTVEDYLKQMYLEQQEAPGDLVPMGRLAGAVQVAPGTATAMVKALADAGLVRYAPRHGVRLTRRGERLALHVLRRHRLIELFLVRVLRLDWSRVHQEAERLEHAVSDKVLERIDAFLGRPSVDPHGDPIPTAKGRLAQQDLDSLADCPLGRRVRIVRVIDQDAAFLQFVERSGLTPGVDLVVQARDGLGETVTLCPRGAAAVTIGTVAAAKIRVQEPGRA